MLSPEADSSTSIPFNYSISDKTELKRRHGRKTLLNWITHNHISFRQVETEEFQLFASSLNNKYALYIPTSHAAISNWIREEFQCQKNDTREQLSQAQSQIHLLFDLWTSPFRNFAVLSIVAYFLYKNNKNTALLLSLCRNRDSYNGENMGKLVLEILKEYKIQNCFGYFVLDNVSSNDNA